MPHQCTNCGRTFDDGSKEMLSGCPDCGGNKFQFRPSSAVSAGDAGDATAGDAAASDSSTVTDDRPSASPQSPDSASKGSDSGGVTGAAADAGSAVRDWVRGSSSSASSSSPETAEGSSADSPEVSASESAETSASETSASETEGASASGTPEASEPSQPPRSPKATPPTTDDREEGEDSAQASARTDVVSPEELSAAAQKPEEPAEADESVQPGLAELREELNEQFESIKIVNPGQYELNLMELYDRDEYIISLREDGRYVIEVPDRWHGDDEDDD